MVNKNQVTLVSKSSGKKKADDNKADNAEATPATPKDDNTSVGDGQKTVSTNDSDDDSEQTERSSRKRSYRSRKSQSSSKSSRSSKRQSKKSKKKRNKGQQSKSVTVKSGDTLSEIAERNHTTVKKLRKLNGISGSTIQNGKKIKVK